MHGSELKKGPRRRKRGFYLIDYLGFSKVESGCRHSCLLALPTKFAE